MLIGQKPSALSTADSIVIDLTEPVAILIRLFRDAEPGVFEDLFKLIAEMPRNTFAGFFSNFFKPAYVAVNGAMEHIAELRFVFPRRADELLAAMRAYEVDRHKILNHGTISSVSANV